MAKVPMKRFKPRHEMIVFLHMRGKKNNEIAEALDITSESVWQVLSDPAALLMIDALRTELRKTFVDGIEEQMMELGPIAVERLQETLESEMPVGSRAHKHQDEVSFKLLDRLGFSPSRRDGETGSKGINLDRDIQERLAAALEKSKEVDTYDAAEEADWEEVKESDEVKVANG